MKYIEWVVLGMERSRLSDMSKQKWAIYYLHQGRKGEKVNVVYK